MTSQILIVDPVATNRIVLKTRLMSAFYTVDSAASVEEALQLVSDTRYEAVLIAGELDEDAGAETPQSQVLLQRCKSFADRQITVICLRDFDTHAQAAMWQSDCLSMGADDCLIRPVSSPLLLARLRNLMRDRARRTDLPRALNGGLSTGLARVAPNAPVFVCTIGRPEIVSLPPMQSVLAHQLNRDLGAAILVRDHPLPALTQLRKNDEVPGVLVLQAAGIAIDTAIALLPQLHSSVVLKDARIVLSLTDATAAQMASAFDLGAHEIVCTSMPPEQIATRVLRQLSLHAQEVERRSHVHDQMKLAITDPLTGLHNRRYAMEYLSKLIIDSKAVGAQFALLALDIDHFKSINDSFGHAVGDEVLKSVSDCLKSNIRGSDLVARSGGEEFLIALPDTSHEVAQQAAERLRQKIAALHLNLKRSGQSPTVTISIGVAMQSGETRLEPFLERADQALYAAKANGRNTVSLSSNAA